uniref:Uncharacterized protein n=1 Tax=Oryza sativa subsp. japonica TaxID=39947 RepID=Q67U95_ORYSJ|nr:hypothetical protein [Oryza sativa Japonica Group]
MARGAAKTEGGLQVVVVVSQLRRRWGLIRPPLGRIWRPSRWIQTEETGSVRDGGRRCDGNADGATGRPAAPGEVVAGVVVGGMQGGGRPRPGRRSTTTGRPAARAEAVAGVVAATRRPRRRQLLPLLPSTSLKLGLLSQVRWPGRRRGAQREVRRWPTWVVGKEAGGEVGAASLGAMKLGNNNTLQFLRSVGVSCVQEVVLWRLGLMFKVDNRCLARFCDVFGNDDLIAVELELLCR